MPRPQRVLLFPLWRDLWAGLEDVPDLLALAENALARRMRGNRPIVRPEPFNPSDEWLAAVVCHWATTKVTPPADPAKRVEVARHLHSTYEPALQAVRWPRWLLLERAFLDSSATGDLLFAASVLRTMCEEVQRLRALDAPQTVFFGCVDLSFSTPKTRPSSKAKSGRPLCPMAMMMRSKRHEHCSTTMFIPTMEATLRLSIPNALPAHASCSMQLSRRTRPSLPYPGRTLGPECAATRRWLARVVAPYRQAFSVGDVAGSAPGERHSRGPGDLGKARVCDLAYGQPGRSFGYLQRTGGSVVDGRFPATGRNPWTSKG